MGKTRKLPSAITQSNFRSGIEFILAYTTKIMLVPVAFVLMTFCMASEVLARSESLTTTIVITVKAEPKSEQLPNEQDIEFVKELTANQSMTQPYIRKEPKQALASSERELYTITDRL